MENIKVSVIVLTYNHEKYIEQALDSILMQKVSFNYEILVGDDASTDATVPILLEYKKRYPDIIKLFLNKENVGATRNAYNLLMKAEGEYLATCEGDDYWTDENKLQEQVVFLDENPEFVGCTHRFSIVDDRSVVIKNQHLNWVKQKKNFTIRDFQGIYLPGQPSTFLKRNIKNNSVISLELLYKADCLISDRTSMFIYLLNGDFYFLDKQMSAYRMHKKSITQYIHKNRKKYWQTDYNLIKKYEGYLLKYNFNLDFSRGKQIIIAKALAYYLITLDNDYLVLSREIYNDLNNKIECIMAVLCYWVKRALKI